MHFEVREKWSSFAVYTYAMEIPALFPTRTERLHAVSQQKSGSEAKSSYGTPKKTQENYHNTGEIRNLPQNPGL